ncbi:sensor domain-containing protein [Streptomyces sp. NPDC048290]|uniref:sensor histidine kinase n=1 Tax=Streptomyces sp. NPDC048290 TaxID=3155811 RepID=UPI003421D4BD
MWSLYLLTAPVIAVAGLVSVLGGVFVAAVALLLPGGSPAVARALAPARWFADLERWRIARVRLAITGAGAPVDRLPGPKGSPTGRAMGRAEASGPGPWLDAAHAVLVVPVVLVTSAVTALWWFVGIGSVTCSLRYQYAPAEPLRPLSLNLGDAQSHVTVSLGLSSPIERVVFGTLLGLLTLFTLPLVTRVCAAAQSGLGQALLSDTSALHRRISGLEQERDTARAQTAAAVAAEATALRRLERDIHDGPQQRLIRLAVELGRVRHHFDRRPETAREALADAIVQAQEALDELRALSRGIAPPILVDRGLHAALAALAARSTILTELDAVALDHRPKDAVETAAYFVAAEALTNVAKHSGAQRCVIGLRHDAGVLRVWVTDDGVGGAALDKGHGLRGLEDRLLALGGRSRISSPPGGPTTITGELPCC